MKCDKDVSRADESATAARLGADTHVVTGRQKLLHVFWLLVLGALWGSSYLFIKVTVAEVPALTLVAGRLAVGALIMWVLLLLSGQELPKGGAPWGAYTVMGLLSGAIPYALISWGEMSISSGLASLLQATMPISTVVLAHWMSDEERLTWPKVGGVIVGFVGVGILLISGQSQEIRGSVAGQLAIIGSSVSYATATLFARTHLRGQSPLVAATGQFTTGALAAVPVSLLVDRPFSLSPSLAALGSWLGLTLLGTVVAYIIYYALLERTSATFVSTVTYVIPVNGLFLGAVVLGEALSATILVSLALILASIALVRS